MFQKLTIILFSFFLLFFPLYFLHAQVQSTTGSDIFGGFHIISGNAGFETTNDAGTIFGQQKEYFILYQISVIIGLSMMALGIIFLGIVIYGGLLWMTAQGKGEQIERAVNMVKHGAIGVLIIASAYIISFFVSNTILQITQNPSTATETEEVASPWELILYGILQGADYIIPDQGAE